jgi:hypothetical protein
VFTGAVRELGRAARFPVKNGWEDTDGKTPGAETEKFPPFGEPETEHKQMEQQGIREGKRKSNDPETDVRQS